MLTTPYPASRVPEPGSDGRVKLLPLSDLHLPKPGSELILTNRAYLDRMDHVVFMGDMVAAYGTDREYQAVRAFVERLQRPYTAISGNHEWFFDLFEEDSGLYLSVWTESDPAQRRQQIAKFQRFWGKEELWEVQRNSLGTFLFLSLDNLPGLKQESLSPQQLEFLRQQVLEAGEKPLFIFCHCPLGLGRRLDMVYYDKSRTGCVDLEAEVRQALLERQSPTFWMSGHIHLHPNHYLFAPYRCGGNVWQIHLPDSWGYGRWKREQNVPQQYEGIFSRHLEIETSSVTFVTHDHRKRVDIAEYTVEFFA